MSGCLFIAVVFTTMSDLGWSVIEPFDSSLVDSLTVSNQEAVAFDSNDDKKPLEIRDVELLLESSDSENFRASGNLGGVLPNQTYRINFRIKNPFEYDIAFDSSRPPWNGTNVKFQQMTIPSRQSVQVTMTYRSPEFEKHGKIAFSLVLLRRWPPGTQNTDVMRPFCTLNFSGYLRGVIDLGPQSHLFEVQENVDEYLIPIVITEPIQWEDLNVKVSPELKDISAEIVKNSGGHVAVRIGAAKNALTPSGIAGEVTVSHSPTQTEQKIQLTVAPQLPVKISPSFLAFFPSDQNDRIVEATAVIRVNEAAEPSSDDEDQSDFGDGRTKGIGRDERRTPRNKSLERLEISDCKVGEYRLEHEALRLADSIWKVRFRMPKHRYEQLIESHREQQKSNEGNGRDVRFRIRIGDRQFDMQVRLL